jgi:hypothetical protein
MDDVLTLSFELTVRCTPNEVADSVRDFVATTPAPAGGPVGPTVTTAAVQVEQTRSQFLYRSASVPR